MESNEINVWNCFYYFKQGAPGRSHYSYAQLSFNHQSINERKPTPYFLRQLLIKCALFYWKALANVLLCGTVYYAVLSTR